MLDKKIITAQQSRGARAMLGWTRDELAKRSNVSPATLADFEAEKRIPYDRTLADIRRALEEGGIVFIDEDGGGPGVRLRRGGGKSSKAARKVAATKQRPMRKRRPQPRAGFMEAPLVPAE